MSEWESAGTAVAKCLQHFDKKFKKKLVSHGIFSHWKALAGPVAEDVFPIKVDGETVILYATNSAAKDNFKYIAKDILDAANEIIGGGEEIFKKIDFAKSFNRANSMSKKFSLAEDKNISAQKINFLANIELSADEIAECEKKVSEIKNPALKKIALESFINQKKSYKSKIQDGWHECKICDSLCEPSENICKSCRIDERNKMRQFIRQLFCKYPDTKFYDAVKEAKKNFPHIEEEISVEVVASERSSLINSLASKVSVGDEKSDAAKFLVMVYRHLTKEKLTDEIIHRALWELRFNLSDQAQGTQEKAEKAK